MSRPLPTKESMSRLVDTENGWCLRANRVCARNGALRYFAAVSRLGDGVFWYVLMGALIVFDGMAGLRASLHLAATGVIALTLYKLLKRWTRRPRPFASDVRIHAWVAPLDEFSFPSGHTLHAVAFGLVAMAHYPALALLLVPSGGATPSPAGPKTIWDDGLMTRNWVLLLSRTMPVTTPPMMS